MPRVLIACDKFKGSATSQQIADALGRGLRRVAGTEVSAIAVADDPVAMARAFRMAIDAGLLARQAGPGARSTQAQATSPLTGFLEAIS